jgi:hypothetical protein
VSKKLLTDTVDPATLTPEEWQKWRSNPASLTEEAVRDLEAYHREIAPAKEWMDRFDEEERKKRWEKVAIPDYARKLGRDTATLTPGERKTLVDYDPYAFECAQAAGLNPLTLTPKQQKELADFPPGTAKLAKALGLNPLTLTPEEREDLDWGQSIITQAQKLGLDPSALSSGERYDLSSTLSIFPEWKSRVT